MHRQGLGSLLLCGRRLVLLIGLLTATAARGQPLWDGQETAQQMQGWAALIEEAAADGRLTPVERNRITSAVPELVQFREPDGRTRQVDFAGLRNRLRRLESADDLKQEAALLQEWARLRSQPAALEPLPGDFDTRLQQVLADERLERYRRPSGLTQLMQRVIEKVLGWLLAHLAGPLGMAGRGARWFMSVLFAVVVVLVLTAAFYFLHLLYRRRRPVLSQASEEEAAGEEAGLRTASAWWQWAERKAAEGDYRQALRGLLQAVLLAWDEQGVLRFQPARTNWEILGLLRSQPALRAAFAEWVPFFERKVYGLQACSAGEYDQALRQALDLRQGMDQGSGIGNQGSGSISSDQQR